MNKTERYGIYPIGGKYSAMNIRYTDHVLANDVANLLNSKGYVEGISNDYQVIRYIHKGVEVTRFKGAIFSCHAKLIMAKKQRRVAYMATYAADVMEGLL